MKKILFLIPSLRGGGAERVLVNLVNNLDKTKYEITVQTLFDVGINRKYLDKHIKYISGFRKQFPGNTKVLKILSPKSLYRLLVKKRYDIVVSYLEGPTARIVAGCPFDDTKLVSWIHTLQFNRRNAAYSYRTEEEAMRCFQKYHMTICVAQDVKKDFLSFYPKARNMCKVLYNTNETEEIQKKANENIEGDCLSAQINIASVGRLIPEKGYDRLVEVHRRLLEQGIKHHIYILGKGSEEDALKKMISDCGVESTFHLLGFHANPYKYVSKADLFVCSSRREGFSTAVTEALIMGVPVVSTMCSGAKELLGDNNEWGIVTENSEEGVFDGLYKMLATPGLLEQYREKAKERGKLFSKDNTVKAVENMFDNLLKE